MVNISAFDIIKTFNVINWKVAINNERYCVCIKF